MEKKNRRIPVMDMATAVYLIRKGYDPKAVVDNRNNPTNKVFLFEGDNDLYKDLQDYLYERDKVCH